MFIRHAVVKMLNRNRSEMGWKVYKS